MHDYAHKYGFGNRTNQETSNMATIKAIETICPTENDGNNFDVCMKIMDSHKNHYVVNWFFF